MANQNRNRSGYKDGNFRRQTNEAFSQTRREDDESTTKGKFSKRETALEKFDRSTQNFIDRANARIEQKGRIWRDYTSAAANVAKIVGLALAKAQHPEWYEVGPTGRMPASFNPYISDQALASTMNGIMGIQNVISMVGHYCFISSIPASSMNAVASELFANLRRELRSNLQYTIVDVMNYIYFCISAHALGMSALQYIRAGMSADPYNGYSIDMLISTLSHGTETKTAYIAAMPDFRELVRSYVAWYNSAVAYDCTKMDRTDLLAGAVFSDTPDLQGTQFVFNVASACYGKAGGASIITAATNTTGFTAMMNSIMNVWVDPACMYPVIAADIKHVYGANYGHKINLEEVKYPLPVIYDMAICLQRRNATLLGGKIPTYSSTTDTTPTQQTATLTWTSPGYASIISGFQVEASATTTSAEYPVISGGMLAYDPCTASYSMPDYLPTGYGPEVPRNGTCASLIQMMPHVTATVSSTKFTVTAEDCDILYGPMYLYGFNHSATPYGGALQLSNAYYESTHGNEEILLNLKFSDGFFPNLFACYSAPQTDGKRMATPLVAYDHAFVIPESTLDSIHFAASASLITPNV